MMSKSETYAIFSYLGNLLQSRQINIPRLRKGILEWLEESEAVLLLENNEETEKLKKDEVDKTEKIKIIKALITDALKKMQKPVPGVLEKTLSQVGQLFNLSHQETMLLAVLVRKEKHRLLESFFETLVEGMYGNEKMDSTEFFAALLDSKAKDIAPLLRPKGKLLSCGLINCGRRNLFNASEKIMQAFQTGVSFSNPNKLRDLLAGDVQFPTLRWEDFTHMGQDRLLLETLLKHVVEQQEKGINILIYGKPGTGKTEFCKTLAARVGISLYSAAEIGEEGEEADRAERLQSLRMLQAILGRSGKNAVMFDEAEDVFGYASGEGLFSQMFSGHSAVRSKVYMNRLLEGNAVPVFWLTNSVKGIDKAFIRRMSYCLEFAELPFDVRLRMSKNVCRKSGLHIPDEDIRELTHEYEMPPAIFANAARIASLIGGGTQQLRQVVDSQEKILGGKKNVDHNKTNFSTELLHTEVNLEQLAQKILSNGRKDFSLFLYGPPGTGKSEYVRWLAEKMGMEVLLKRASDIFSKWVGGTEENIAEAFNEACRKNKFLVFDEADSFLHSRREARTSWEVSNVNEMLTWMERHPLPFACTTNLSENFDEAAFRRFTFKVRFHCLTAQQVEMAFQQFFGLKAPEQAHFLVNLTPGDFAVVKKKAEYFWPVSAQELTDMLGQEVAVKTEKHQGRKMGFQVG